MTKSTYSAAVRLAASVLMMSTLGCDTDSSGGSASYPEVTPTLEADWATPTPSEGDPDASAIPEGAALEVNQSALAFGLVERGQAESRDVLLTNVSDQPVVIGEVFVQGSEAFRMTYAPTSEITLEPGQALVVAVSFAPEWDMTAAGQLVIPTSDPTAPVIKLNMSGECHSPLAEIMPPVLDFTGTLIDCPVTETVLITNKGHEELIVDDLFFEGAENIDFSFDLDAEMPLTLAPGQRVTAELTYRPSDTEADFGAVVLISNDAQEQERVHPVAGSGRYPSEMAQTFYAGKKRPVDVLVVVDNSGSMCDEQRILAENLQNFMAIVEAQQVPFHIGVVDVEDGYLEGDPIYITNDTPDRYQAFFDNAFVGCDGWQGVERGLEISTRALYRQKYIESNGFYRQDAALRVLYISDEPDQSMGPVELWVEALRHLKDDRDDVVLTAIAGEPHTGCRSDTASAGPGDRYLRAAEITGGGFETICAPDFIDVVEDMAWESVIEFDSRYPLTHRPDPGTITVTIDGANIPQSDTNGWSYNDRDQVIELTGSAIPEVFGARVDISYTESSTCKAALDNPRTPEDESTDVTSASDAAGGAADSADPSEAS